MIEAIDELTSTSTTDQIPPTYPAAHTAALASDIAILSEAAQVTLLSQEGLSITQISEQLGVTTNVVLQDLGITNPTAAA